MRVCTRVRAGSTVSRLLCVLLLFCFAAILNFSIPPWKFRRMDTSNVLAGPRRVKKELDASFIKVPRVKQFSCVEVLSSSDAGELNRSISKATARMASMGRHGISDLEYTDMTKNCVDFKKRRGYILDPMRKVEKDFPIAYSLVVYKDTEQIERLLRAIYRPQNVYCVHVDSKTKSETFNAIRSIVNCFDNVFIASKRYDVKWATLTVLLPDMLCMEELLNHRIQWRYFVNLAGQEFPLKTNGDLVKIMKALDGANDLESTLKGLDTKRYNKSVITGKIKGPAPHQIVIYKGNMHMTASREFVNFIINNQKAKDFYAWINDTVVPEEQFFASLQHNPKLGAPGAYTGSVMETDKNTKPFISRYMVWANSGAFMGSCRGKYVRSVCVMGVGDLPNLVNSKELFVNKFHLDYQYLALDCFEQWLFEQMRKEYNNERKFNTKYYEELEIVKHKL